MSKIEEMLSALLNGEKVDIVPRSRKELFLKNCVDGCGCVGLPTPRSRSEVLLYELADKINKSSAEMSEVRAAMSAKY